MSVRANALESWPSVGPAAVRPVRFGVIRASGRGRTSRRVSAIPMSIGTAARARQPLYACGHARPGGVPRAHTEALARRVFREANAVFRWTSATASAIVWWRALPHSMNRAPGTGCTLRRPGPGSLDATGKVALALHSGGSQRADHARVRHSSLHVSRTLSRARSLTRLRCLRFALRFAEGRGCVPSRACFVLRRPRSWSCSGCSHPARKRLVRHAPRARSAFKEVSRVGLPIPLGGWRQPCWRQRP